MLNTVNLHKQNIQFQGYAACPLKTLYLQTSQNNESRKTTSEAAKELQTIGQSEGFNVVIHSEGTLYSPGDRIPKPSSNNIFPFLQDTMIFLPRQRGEGKVGIFNYWNMFDDRPDVDEVRKLASELGRQTEDLLINTEGGDVFIGKKDDGKFYALVGERPSRTEDVKRQLSQAAGIDISDITIITRTSHGDRLDFHLDTFMRPLKYPYILVNDPDLVIEEAPETEEYQRKVLADENLTPTDTIERSLKDFKPIRVPGLFWGDTTNYMNAIVHERPNGDLVYITNSSTKKRAGISYDELFENYITRHVPCIKKVVFIKNHLLKSGDTILEGGIHCMACEEPDFDSWA